MMLWEDLYEKGALQHFFEGGNVVNDVGKYLGAVHSKQREKTMNRFCRRPYVNTMSNVVFKKARRPICLEKSKREQE